VFIFLNTDYACISIFLNKYIKNIAHGYFMLVNTLTTVKK